MAEKYRVRLLDWDDEWIDVEAFGVRHAIEKAAEKAVEDEPARIGETSDAWVRCPNGAVWMGYAAAEPSFCIAAGASKEIVPSPERCRRCAGGTEWLFDSCPQCEAKEKEGDR